MSLDPVVVALLRIGGALVLVGAALHKLRDREAFRAAVTDYRLLPAPAARALAPGLAAAELGVGLALLVPGTALLAAGAGCALLGLYAGAMAVNLARGRRDIDCGCGGPGGSRPLSWGGVARNGVLAAALAAAGLLPAARAWTGLDVATLAAALAAGALLYAALDVALANAARLASLPRIETGGPPWKTP